MAKITSPSSTAIGADVVRQAVGEKYREIKRMRSELRINFCFSIVLVKKGKHTYQLYKCCFDSRSDVLLAFCVFHHV